MLVFDCSLLLTDVCCTCLVVIVGIAVVCLPVLHVLLADVLVAVAAVGGNCLLLAVGKCCWLMSVCRRWLLPENAGCY